MKKPLLCTLCLALAAALTLSSCSSGQPQQMQDSVPASAAEAVHVCQNACPECGLCANLSCLQPECAEKCPHFGQEDPFPFPQGDFITDSATTIHCEDVVFEIGENIYIPSHLIQVADLGTAAMEKVSGLSYGGTGFADSHGDGKIHVFVSRDNLYAGQDWYQGLDSSEMGYADASSSGEVALSPGDVFLFREYTFLHEMAHDLMFRQSPWSHCKLLNEGFAQYTTYLAQLDMQKNHPDAAVYFGDAKINISDMLIHDYDKLFEHPLEYWFENTFEYSSNANYTIGFRFMWYLYETQGDYSRWVTETEKRYPSGGIVDTTTTAQQDIAVLKACYGEDVLDNFYPWLREHLDYFEDDPDLWRADMTAVTGFNLYPIFNAVESRIYLGNTVYEDMYVNLESARRYLTEYKGIDNSGLQLTVYAPQPTTVRLYTADGSYREVVLQGDETVSLEGIRYIRLVGSGEFDTLEITGFEGQYNPYTQE